MADALYYAKGLEVWKSPVRTKIKGGESVSVGFLACTASDVVGEEGAIAIAALLCLGEQAQTPSPQPNVAGVTLSAEQVIAIRDALIADDVMEAYHQLYQAVDPQFCRYEPWADTEAQLRRSPAETPTPPGNQIRTAECDGKDVAPVTGQLPVGAASPQTHLVGDGDINPYEQALRDAVEPFLDWLEQREEGAHIQEVREGLIGVEDVIPDDHVVLGAHLRAHKDQGVLTIGHFRRLQAAYDGKTTPAPETREVGS